MSQKEKNFYDHFIDKNIQFDKFKEIKEYINSRLFQNSGTISQQQDKDYGLGFDV